MKLTAITLALALAAVSCLTTPSYGQKIAPLYVQDESIKDSYIVMLKAHVELETHANWVEELVWASAAAKGLHTENFGIHHLYNLSSTVKGYSGTFDEQTIQAIRESDDVEYVEMDSIVYTSELQRNAPWGLARISHRERLNLRTFRRYRYEAEGGKDIKVYVIDTGININHVDFEGRATWGVTVPSGERDEDGNGHGSHCAGTIAGRRFGVAKKARPVAVKVLRANGSGSLQDVAKGIDWAVERHLEDQMRAKRTGKTYKGAVANMSLGAKRSPTLDRLAVEAGMVFSVAAGNDNDDACNYSPAGAELAITVGASTLYDERAFFSNYGPCVDVFAPGLDIQSVWKTGKYSVKTLSGTSMASPHVAGLSAYFLSLEQEQVTPRTIKKKILTMATKDALSSLPANTANILVYNGATD